MFIVPFLPANQLLHSVMLRFLTASVALSRNVGFCPLATGTPIRATTPRFAMLRNLQVKEMLGFLSLMLLALRERVKQWRGGG